MKSLLILVIVITLCACSKLLDPFNEKHPEAVRIEDAIEIGAEHAGDLILNVPVGTLEGIFGQTQSPVKNDRQSQK